MDEIQNKVKESGLIQLDLADYKPRERLIGIDISHQLWQGLLLREKDFRAWIKSNDWNQYRGQNIYVYCSVDAIIPTWAYMLVTSALVGIAKKCLIGSSLDLEKSIIQDEINKLDERRFLDQRVIIKGCSDIHCPEFAMSCLVQKLQQQVKSIMYGEPCSTVPIFKRKEK